MPSESRSLRSVRVRDVAGHLVDLIEQSAVARATTSSTNEITLSLNSTDLHRDREMNRLAMVINIYELTLEKDLDGPFADHIRHEIKTCKQQLEDLLHDDEIPL